MNLHCSCNWWSRQRDALMLLRNTNASCNLVIYSDGTLFCSGSPFRLQLLYWLTTHGCDALYIYIGIPGCTLTDDIARALSLLMRNCTRICHNFHTVETRLDVRVWACPRSLFVRLVFERGYTFIYCVVLMLLLGPHSITIRRADWHRQDNGVALRNGFLTTCEKESIYRCLFEYREKREREKTRWFSHSLAQRI